MERSIDRLRVVLIDGARGALVGAVVGVAVWLIAAGAYDCRRPGLGCVPVALAAIGGALLVAGLVSWLLFFALRATSPHAMALAGTGATVLVVVVAGGDSPRDPVSMAGLAAAGYAAVGLTLSAGSPVVLRVTVGVLLAAGVVVLFLHP